MSYLVLARKYRPKTFAEVVGQEHVTRTLANAFATGRVHHAFLFCGPRGVGKTTLARIVGKALNCEKGPTAEPCGACSACETITNGTAVDYFEMDGASNRGIDAIRDLTDAVRYQPAMLRKKVYVIDEVHMLTTEAFNALLKTLEEPPPHVSFVLATTEPHKIPNTILSRCQRYDFKLVPANRLSEHLNDIFKRESLVVESGAVSLLVRESGGSVRDALSLCDQIISYVGTSTITEAAVAEVLGVADRSLTRTLVMALAHGDARTALEAVDSAIDRGVDEVQLARAVVRYLRDLAVVQVAPDSEGLVDGSADERTELAQQASSLDRRRVVQMFDRMVRACHDLGQTQQPRLILDLALIDVAALEPLLPLGDLIERLGALEHRIAGKGGGGGTGGRAKPRGPAPRNVPPPPRLDSAPSLPRNEPSSNRVTAPPGPMAPEEPIRAAPPPARFEDIPPPDDELIEVAPPDEDAPGSEVFEPAEPAPLTRARPETPPLMTQDAGPQGKMALPPADVLGEWEEVVSALGAVRRTLSSLYEHAKVLTWDDRSIELGLPPELGPVAEMATDQANVRALKEFLHQRYGQFVGVAVRLLSAEEASSPAHRARSVVDVTRQRADDERQKREAEVHKHPIYNKVLETFGAPVKEEINTNV